MQMRQPIAEKRAKVIAFLACKLLIGVGVAIRSLLQIVNEMTVSAALPVLVTPAENAEEIGEWASTDKSQGSQVITKGSAILDVIFGNL